MGSPRGEADSCTRVASGFALLGCLAQHACRSDSDVGISETPSLAQATVEKAKKMKSEELRPAGLIDRHGCWPHSPGCERVCAPPLLSVRRPRAAELVHSPPCYLAAGQLVFCRLPVCLAARLPGWLLVPWLADCLPARVVAWLPRRLAHTALLHFVGRSLWSDSPPGVGGVPTAASKTASWPCEPLS